jgi:hypothetical protein
MPDDAAWHFAIWLLPREPQRSQLRSTILRLAARHATLAFEPHVTVFAGRRTRSEGVDQRLADELAGLPPIVLRGGRHDTSPEFFKTVFIAFERDPVLERIARNVGASLRKPQVYDLRPHLSLIYKTLREADRRTIVATLGPAPATLVCDEMVVASPGPTDDWRAVAGWRVEHRVRLDGPSP